MSRNPWGSDSYDYNPDYNHLNEQYDQNSQYGQYGQGSYGQYGQSSYDQYPYDPYGQDLYGQNQYDPYGYQYDQPMMVPAGFLQKTPEQFFGEKAAQTSTVLGVIGLICIVTLNWWLLGLPLPNSGCYRYFQGERGGTLRCRCFGRPHLELD